MSIVTLTGPTCSGKSTVEAELQLLGFGRAISHTTRLPRAGEVNGGAYHFVTDDEYARLEGQGAFIETVHFGSSKYAMSADALNQAQTVSEHVVIVVEPMGAEQIHAYCGRYSLKSEAVWVDCSTTTQARRWIGRMLADSVQGKEVVGPYAERLALMLSEEVSWRRLHAIGDIAAFGDYRYNLSLNSDQLSPQNLAAAIVDHLNR